VEMCRRCGVVHCAHLFLFWVVLDDVDDLDDDFTVGPTSTNIRTCCKI
jgi:hypothetical protein